MDVGKDGARLLVVCEGAAADCLDVLEVDGAPDRRVGNLELLAGADELDVSHAGDEHRDEALPYVVLSAELGERGVEGVAVVEVDGESLTNLTGMDGSS